MFIGSMCYALPYALLPDVVTFSQPACHIEGLMPPANQFLMTDVTGLVQIDYRGMSYICMVIFVLIENGNQFCFRRAEF